MTDRPTTEPLREGIFRVWYRRSPGMPERVEPIHNDSDLLDAYQDAIEAAQGAAPRAEGLDVERLAATEWAYDTMPESFDVIRDPVKVWNDRLYPASDHDKDRYRRRAAAILARLSRPSDERVPESEEPR